MLKQNSKILTISELEGFQSAIGGELPQSFLDFYLQFNGGVPNENSAFYVEEDDGYVIISFFLPIKYKSGNLGDMLIESSHKNLINKGFPQKFIPFAVDRGGNYFCIDSETGNIILLLVDMGKFNDESVKSLENSFDLFIDSLEKEEEEEDV